MCTTHDLGVANHTSHDEQAGIEVAAAWHPEAIFLDIGMPKLNGYDECRRFRQQP
jgi:CheY-like chemotaxis protein